MDEQQEGSDQAENEETPAMGFFEHLEEMRKRVLWAAIGLAIGCIVTGFFIREIMEHVLLAPAVTAGLELQNLRPLGQPILHFKLVFVIGIIVSFPFTLYQIWKFVMPGLYNHERSWARMITFFTTICFLTGVAFGYIVMIPMMLDFAAGFSLDTIDDHIDINMYFSFVSMMVLSAGLIFELPMVTFVLSKIGLVTPEFMRKYRRHAIVVILILAAILTPTPDPFGQLLFATPVWILYEISIIISKFIAEGRLKNEKTTS